MKLWSICFLITFPLLCHGQNEEGYDDPLRKTLGLLGRIMNRMAQPNPPTDEQLHFTVNDPPDIKALSELIRQQQKRPLSKTDKIINEELLQRLIPRVKGITLPPRTPPTTTTKVPKTTVTTTVATTTTISTTTTPPPTTTTTTTTSAPTTVTTKSPATTTKRKDSSLIVRVKSVDELQKSLEASAELNDEDSRNARIVAEALRILLKEEGMNATKATEKLRAIAKAAIEKATSETKTTISPTTTTTTTEPTTTVKKVVKDFKEEKIVKEADEESALSEEEEEETETDEPTEETTEEAESSTVATDPIVFKQASVRIPEAEEEELPTKNQEKVDVSFQDTDTTSTTRAPLSGQTVYNLNANANSESDPRISNVFTPVNAIVDGIGPLILPLIGYSRQALQYYPRAQGVNTFQPDNGLGGGGKPVQLRSLPKGYGFGGGQEQQQQQQQQRAFAKGTPIQQQQTLSSLKTATTDQLIEAFHRASQTNNLAASPSRPYSRYVPNPSSVNSYYTQEKSQQNLEQLRKSFIQSNQAEYDLKQPQEIIGTTLATEPTYYGPQIDRHIGQNFLAQGVRHREEPQKSPLPVETNPDPAYAEGLKKVTAFVGDSGVMTGDENAPSLIQESGLPPARSETNGFGGGKGPNASFDEVVKNTEQEPSYNFLG